MTDQIPIVYHPEYNIGLCGIEKVLHSFDTHKYGRVHSTLSSRYNWHAGKIHSPEALPEEDLLLVHTSDYLKSLSSATTIARIAEVPFLALFPSFLLQSNILHPMKLATSGTILASQLALQYGWAINLSGGYHHAKAQKGEGFCFFADIPLAAKKLLMTGQIHKVLVVDLDAHQGNGLPTLFSSIGKDEKNQTLVEYNEDNRIAILDMFNGDIYPGDSHAKQFIKYNGQLRHGMKDDVYTNTLHRLLPSAIMAEQPNIVFYNAGTDIYEDDPLGALGITKEGIIARDEFVFRLCREAQVPIVMVLSGGYTMKSAEIIADSLTNLHEKGLISLV